MQEVVAKLNNLVAKLKQENQQDCLFFSDEILFDCGDMLNDLPKFIASKIPNGKIAVLYKKDTYSLYGVNFTKAIQRLSRETLNIIIPDTQVDIYDVNSLKNVFSLADDVRIILTFDPSLVMAVNYFATIRNIPSLYFINGFSLNNVLSPFVTIKNQNNKDNFAITCDRFIYINNQIDNYKRLSLGYANVLSNLVTLLDYRIYKITSSEVSITAYSLARQAIYAVYDCMQGDTTSQLKVILENVLKVELANYISGGLLYKTSSSQNCLQFFADDEKASSKYAFLCALKILHIYTLVFSQCYDDILTYPDYLQRAEQIAEIINCDKSLILKNLLEQSKKIQKNSKELQSLMQKLSVEVEALLKCLPVINNTYIALGGDCKIDNQIMRYAIKYASGLTDCVNGLSIALNKGFLELI